MIEAVAAIFVYQNEIFSIRRQNYLRAFPGFFSFPGGKIDPEDYNFDFQHSLLEDYPAHEMGALFREIAEELGYSIHEAINQNIVTEVSKLGTAVTPPFEKFRFNAHYYKVVLTKKPKLIVDDGEIAWAGWLSHSDLNEKYHAGDALMVVPTVRTIEHLLKDISTQKIKNLNLEYDLENELPYLELLKGVGCIYVPSNTLPPAHTTNSLVLGDEGSLRLITDPSPESDDVFEKLVRTLEKYPIEAILLTHHHPDHHERAPQLARQLKLPILSTKITQHRLLDKYGEDYLDDIEIKNIAQDDKITKWLGKEVICHELPGHDDGMVGLASEDMSWFYVSDLVEQFTTVVIPEPEGDMQVYFDSLNRVIAHNPKVIIPSHGMPMGGIHLIEKTLHHRIEREKQIIKLLSEGIGEDKIVDELYSGLDKRLLPLAHQNVRQHIRKIRADALAKIQMGESDFF